jgi:hypothetical protein
MRKMLSHAATCVAVTLLATAILASAPAAAPKHTDPGRDYYASEGFSLVPAQGWEKQVMAPPGFFMMYTNPPPKMSNVPSLTATVNKISLDNVDEIMEKVKKTVQAGTPPVKVVEEGKVTINGRAAFYLSGTFSGSGKEYQNLQYFIIGGNKKMYIITLTCLPNTLAPLRPAVEKMAMSIVTD